jgi:hypothetical protein
LSDIQAESIKQVESGAVSSSETGDRPTPIRKRGYHRALKRGEHWATYKKAVKDMMNDMARAMFEDMIKPSPFLKMIGLSEDTGRPIETDIKE